MGKKGSGRPGKKSSDTQKAALHNKTSGKAIQLPPELQKLEKQIDLLSDLTLIINSDGMVVKCSRPSDRIKIARRVLLNKDIFAFYKSASSKEEVFSEVFSQNGLTLGLAFEYAKGKEIPMLTRWIPYRMNPGNNKIILVLNFVNDISIETPDRIRSDEQGDEFSWISNTGVKDRSTEFSNNLVAITGFTNNEIRKKPDGFMSIIHEEDYSAVKNSYMEFLSNTGQKSIRLTYRVVTKDERVIWLKEIIKVSRDKKGNPLTSAGTVTDVSDLVKADEVLVRTIDHLRVQNNSKDRFISMLSHDLRAPFTTILGFAEILANEPELPEAVKEEYLSYIYEASNNQLQLVNYLLDWSRLQTGKMKIEPRRLHVQSVIFNCVSTLTGNAVRKDINIKVNAGERIFVQADEKLLTEVITNLLNNAIKFSIPGKSVDISADIFNDELIEFIVKDEGVGIAEEDKSKLFKIEELFTTEGTNGEKGTGIGLSLIKEIVEKHRGQIWFYSEKGRGSEFHFTIMRSPNIILLVEPTEKDRESLEHLLKKNYPAFRIISTSNGYEAMKVVLERLPSLVITGHSMPLMSGLQLIKSIRREEKNYSIPVILIAKEIDDHTKDSYRQLKVPEILQKPVNNEKLLEILDLVLSM